MNSQMIYQKEALDLQITKKSFSRSFEVTRAQIGVIWGQNEKIFQHRALVYENEGLWALIPEKCFSRSSEVTWAQIRVIWGKNTIFLHRVRYSKIKAFELWFRENGSRGLRLLNQLVIAVLAQHKYELQTPTYAF